MLKCNDDQFVDFISKCLTWDPDRRLKPQPAMRHPWILAGRRRYAPAPPLNDRGSVSLTGSTGSSGPSPAGRYAGLNHSGSAHTSIPHSSSALRPAEKKGLVISPPTPLVAKTGATTAMQMPGSAPRVGSTRVAQTLNTQTSYLVSETCGWWLICRRIKLGTTSRRVDLWERGTRRVKM